jgi:chromosome partitioning protein
VEHHHGVTLDDGLSVPRGTFGTVLAPDPGTGQDAAVTDPQDDLASRRRAIFQRLRGGSDEPDQETAPTEGPADPDDADGQAANEPSAKEEGHLSDEELAEFRVPPPPDHEPPEPLTPGPLPGLEDLPPIEAAVEEGLDADAPPIYVPSEDAEAAVEAEAESPPEPEISPFARPLPRVLAVANQKGGVGKTTTAVNLGACLADLGYRVLVVDLDPQGNASTGLGINIRDLHGSMYDVILHDLPIEDCVEATSVRNLFCAPSSLDLAGAEIELVPAFSRELRLRKALEEVHDDYDFVLIDCPPSLGLLTVNGLAAASEVVVPIQCEYYALEGLGQLLRNVNLVQKNLNPVLEVSAIVLVMYDARTKLADQVVGEVREHFGAKVCKHVVPRTVRLSEAPSFGQPIIAFDPSSRGAIAYRELAKEVSGGTPQRAG